MKTGRCAPVTITRGRGVFGGTHHPPRDSFTSGESQQAVIRFGMRVQPGGTQLGLAA